MQHVQQAPINQQPVLVSAKLVPRIQPQQRQALHFWLVNVLLILQDHMGATALRVLSIRSQLLLVWSPRRVDAMLATLHRTVGLASHVYQEHSKTQSVALFVLNVLQVNIPLQSHLYQIRVSIV